MTAALASSGSGGAVRASNLDQRAERVFATLGSRVRPEKIGKLGQRLAHGRRLPSMLYPFDTSRTRDTTPPSSTNVIRKAGSKGIPNTWLP